MSQPYAKPVGSSQRTTLPPPAILRLAAEGAVLLAGFAGVSILIDDCIAALI